MLVLVSFLLRAYVCGAVTRCIDGAKVAFLLRVRLDGQWPTEEPGGK